MSGRKLGAVLWFYRLGRLIVIMLVYVLELAVVFNHLFRILVIPMSRAITTDPVIFAVLGRTFSILRSRSSILVRYVLLRLCKITYSFNSAATHLASFVFAFWKVKAQEACGFDLMLW
jgi:hypothetical protein